MTLIERLRVSVTYDAPTLRRMCRESADALEAADKMAEALRVAIDNLRGHGLNSTQHQTKV